MTTLGSRQLADTPRASVVVIILNLNRPDDTIRCVESVMRSDYPIRRVIALDNGSSGDDAARISAKFESSIDVYRSETNLGVAAGWNLAISHSNGLYSPDFAFLLNNDTVVDPSVIGELIDFIRKNDRAGVAGPAIVDFLPPHEHQRRVFKDIVEPTIDHYLSGCALLIRLEVFKAIGMFDENYFVYGEETDLLERMKSSRWLPYYVPTRGKVYHKWAETASMMSGFEAFHRARSGLIFRVKHRRGLWGVASLASYFLHWELTGYLSDLRSHDRKNRILSRTRGIVDGLRISREVRENSRLDVPMPSKNSK